MGSFRLTKSNTPHLHGEFKFAEPVLETAENRTAIHASLQLTDEVLRYLWTLMVKAAIHGTHRFATFEIAPLKFTALGRRQSLYIVVRLSRLLCF